MLLRLNFIVTFFCFIELLSSIDISGWYLCVMYVFICVYYFSLSPSLFPPFSLFHIVFTTSISSIPMGVFFIHSIFVSLFLILRLSLNSCSLHKLPYHCNTHLLSSCVFISFTWLSIVFFNSAIEPHVEKWSKETKREKENACVNIIESISIEK